MVIGADKHKNQEENVRNPKSAFKNFTGGEYHQSFPRHASVLEKLLSKWEELSIRFAPFDNQAGRAFIKRYLFFKLLC